MLWFGGQYEDCRPWLVRVKGAEIMLEQTKPGQDSEGQLDPRENPIASDQVPKNEKMVSQELRTAQTFQTSARFLASEMDSLKRLVKEKEALFKSVESIWRPYIRGRSSLPGISSLSSVDLTRGIFPSELEGRRNVGSSAELQTKIHDFEAETIKLKAEINERDQRLQTREADAKQQKTQLEELVTKVRELQEKQNLAHLLNRVRNFAQQKLLESAEFRKQFFLEIPCLAYVLSIDIRRSTELIMRATNMRRDRL
jgi:hypothetical protein